MRKVKGYLLIGLIMCVLLVSMPVKQANASFTDIPRDHYAYDKIQFLVNNKLMSNCTSCKFEPKKPVTRLDVAVMITKAQKLQAPAKPKIVPSDMKSNMTGYKEVLAVLNKGIFSLSGSKFNPKGTVSRKEMAKILSISYKLKGKGKNSFKDVPKGNSYYQYVDAAVENKIIVSYDDGNFRAAADVNKAQLAVFIANIYKEPFEYIVKENGKIIFRTEDSNAAIQLASKRKNTTVHPVGNALLPYSDKTATMPNAGIRNGVLIYNGANEKSAFDTDFFKSYLVRDRESMSGTLFDTFIILGRTYPGGGKFEESLYNQSNYQEWKWYMDRTFAASGALKQLNAAAKETNKKVNVYISIPYPKSSSPIVLLNGKSVKNTPAEREKLVNWYMNSVQSQWNASKFTNIVFKGYYWLNETVISLQDEVLVQKVANTIHSQKKAFIYSPHSKSTNFDRWKTYGFDAAFLQPNAFYLKHTDLETQIALHKAFLQAQINGSGINIEIDSYSELHMELGLRKFAPYVEMAQRYGLPGRSMIMYQEQTMVHRMATFPQKPYGTAYTMLKNLIR